jgi:hypothetical protein
MIGVDRSPSADISRVLVGTFNATPEILSKPPGIVLPEDVMKQYAEQAHYANFRPNSIDFFRMSDQKLEDMAQGIVRLINLANQQSVDRMFFLDKSARPAGYLFLKTWSYLFPDRPYPHISFIEIGRDGRSKMLDDCVPENIKNALIDRYTDLAGKTVCVVDEYVESGGTLIKAKKLFQEVFPKTKRLILTSAFHMCAGWHHEDATGVAEPDTLDLRNAFLVEPLLGWSAASKRSNLRRDLDGMAQAIGQNAKETFLSAVDGKPYIPESASAIKKLKIPLNDW